VIDPTIIIEVARFSAQVVTYYRRMLLAVAAFLVAMAVAVRIALAGQDLGSPPQATEWVLVGLMIALALLVVRVTGFYRRWMPWRTPPPLPIRYTVALTSLAVLVLTEGFAAVSVLLGQQGALAVDPDVFYRPAASGPNASSGGSFAEGVWILANFEEVYLWSLFDAVPTLKIAETLDWSPAFDFDRAGGALVLAYKVLVILPFITLVRSLLKATDKAQPLEGKTIGG
jgi:hypothetical protein